MDLKHDNDLSYAKNNEHFGKAFDIPNDKEYRFALNVVSGTSIIQAFDVQY